MTSENARTANPSENLKELTSSKVYKENLEFWERAWAPVKNPYTQMPDLPYLPGIPAYLQEHKAHRVLDLGCGSGWLSIFLARQGFEVTGLDIAAQALKLGSMWAAEEQLAIKFDVGDIAEIPYAEQSFDAVVANSIFEHLTFDLAQSTMNRVKQLLVPNGVFVGCFDKVGTGPGEFFELSDGTHVYTDKGRRGMMLRCFSNDELRQFFAEWTIDKFDELESGSRFVCACLK
jgi:SAM-dependent methyltransferase